MQGKARSEEGKKKKGYLARTGRDLGSVGRVAAAERAHGHVQRPRLEAWLMSPAHRFCI